MNLQQALVENFKQLSLNQQQEVLDFSEFLKQKSLTSISSQVSNLTPEQKIEKWRKVISKLPQKSANLSDSALHREAIYGDEY